MARSVTRGSVMRLFTVHATKPRETGAVEAIFETEKEATKYALDRSTDHCVTSTSVTVFTMGQLGTRRPVAWFVKGERQHQNVFTRDLFPSGRVPMDEWPTILLVERFIDMERSSCKTREHARIQAELIQRLTPDEMNDLRKRISP